MNFFSVGLFVVAFASLAQHATSQCDVCSAVEGFSSQLLYTLENWLDTRAGRLDAENFRLALRHTSNQISVAQLDALFRFGSTSGSTDQFRDPYFQFFWPDTTSVRLDFFNSAGARQGSIYFEIPKGTKWADFLNGNCQFVAGTDKNVFYPTISESCTTSAFQNGQDQRRFLLAQNANDCESFGGWFMVQPGVSNKKCNWELSLRNSPSFNNDFTAIFYSAFATPNTPPEVAMQVAQKMELRIGGNFQYGSATNGFEKVFRYPNYAGVDALSYFESGNIDPSKDLSSLTAPQVKVTEMFRSDSLHDKLAGAKEVILVIYDSAGTVAETLVFKGTGHKKSWFGRNNLVSTTNWEVTAPFNFFSINGHDGSGRRFYINRSWGGCPNDYGWFVISCGKPDGNPACRNWEEMPGQFLCKIMYTKIIKEGRYATDQIAVASAMEIHTRPYLAPVPGIDGFEKVFRYPNYAGVDVLKYFETGNTDGFKVGRSFKKVKIEDMFRGPNFDQKLAGAKEVMIVVYDAQGGVAQKLVFKGTGDKKSWLGKNNLISASSWDLTGNFNFYSVDGHHDSGRRIYINRSWGGCPNDRGWLVVTCGKPDGNPACRNWEGVPSGEYYCSILYSKIPGPGRFSTNQVSLGSAIEIQIKPGPLA